MDVRQVQFLCVAGAAIALASCGGNSNGGRSGDSVHDVGVGAGTDASGVFRCPSDAGSEPSLDEIAVDAGVAIEDYVRALAIARCGHFSRCAGLAPYVVNECVDALVMLGVWTYWNCTPNAACDGSTLKYNQNPALLLQGVAAGILQYDAQRAGQCVAALLAEGCADPLLIETIPDCLGVFACATADAGSGGAADGGADNDGGYAGFTCKGLLPSWVPVSTCASATDCNPQGQQCVGGICNASACELTDTEVLPDSGLSCTAYAQVGDPCIGNASKFIAEKYPPGWQDSATGRCAPGLACTGQVDGGLGTCVTPQDVGASCSSIDECRLGLACACGVCQIPPSSGPCADGRCMTGVAYCDFAHDVCKPVHLEGESCADGDQSCAPGLTCPDDVHCEGPSN
ncbi:MAG: hypothetical protein FWD17_07845 [Polyangiaceae bacterium]|nr:hypothetical protein [Polyangiaceae bacterium]